MTDLSTGSIHLSVVIPVYKCASCLEELHRRLLQTLNSFSLCFEVIYVEDRSPDECWSLIRKFACTDTHVHGIRLDGNYGQIPAIAAGVSRTSGEWIAVMDCDLQDPPELLGRLLDARQNKELVVFCFERRAHARWRIAASFIFHQLLRWISGNPFSGRCGNFCLAHRHIIDRYLASKMVGALYVTALTSLATDVEMLTYTKEQRFSGKSAYTPGKLMRVALSGLSVYPHRVMLKTFLPSALVLLLAALYLWRTGFPVAAAFAGVNSGVLTSLAVLIYRANSYRPKLPIVIEESQ